MSNQSTLEEPPISKWDKIQPHIEQDIRLIGVPRGEFVVSQMTKSVSQAIRHAFQNYELVDAPALDIGTGTGYHTLLLLSLGHPSVFSVDINGGAIKFAENRIRHYAPGTKFFAFEKLSDFVEASKGLDSAANFYNHSLSDISKYKENKYSTVSFNPPILYPFFKTTFDKPATQGVYFETDNVKDKEQDLVYSFYRDIAQNNLLKGSHIMCVWAGLNRHLVEVNPFQEPADELVHPAKILENWFGFRFDNEPESLADFYCHTTVLGASFFNQSETGKLYSDNIRYGLEKRLYSEMLIPSANETLAGTKFNFGVLHLVKTAADENRFRIVNGSSKEKQNG